MRHAPLPIEPRRPNSGGDPISPHVAALSADLDPTVLAADLVRTLQREVYRGFMDRGDLDDLLRAACHAKIHTLRDILVGARDPRSITVPESIAFARELARVGVPADIVERSYRVGQEAVWQWWIDEVEAYVDATGAPMAEILRSTSPVMFGFVDQMLRTTLAAYDAALDEERRSLADRRRRLVRHLLDGTLTAVGVEAERLLRYRLDGVHLALVLADAPGRAADQVADAARDALGGCGLLLVEDHAAPRTTIWVRLDAAPAPRVRRAATQILESAGRPVALGEPAVGLAGFRDTWQDACDAAEVLARMPRERGSVVWASDVRIEALGLGAPRAARRLVGAELAALRALSPTARDTLEAWLLAGSNVGAAAILGVHEHTVRNRLRDVEHLLGSALRDRRTELHVALRLDAVVHDGTSPDDVRD